jgi:hypothetical protein
VSSVTVFILVRLYQHDIISLAFVLFHRTFEVLLKLKHKCTSDGTLGTLSSQGEQLVVLDDNGQVVVDFFFHQDGTWPKMADGYGSSLEL